MPENLRFFVDEDAYTRAMTSETNPTQSGLSPALLAAYLATDYEVFELKCVLRIGEECAILDVHLAGSAEPGAAFITASNPGSVVCSDEENQQRNHALRVRIDELGVSAVYAGQGRGTDGQWPPEQSFLILGISRSYADLLAAEFGQVAYVWYADGQASLVMTQGASSTR